MVGVSGYKPTIPSREANYPVAPGAVSLAIFGNRTVLPQQLGARNGGMLCPQNYDPVAVDGKIYSNECIALDQTGQKGMPYVSPYGAVPTGAARGGLLGEPGHGRPPMHFGEPRDPTITIPIPEDPTVKPMGAKKGGWLQKADKSMERRGTEGAFTRQAAAHKMGVQQYAAKVIKDMKKKDKSGKKLTAAEKKLLRRAVFARNMGKIAKDRKDKK